VQATAVHGPGDDLPDVVALPVIARDDAVEFSGIVERFLWFLDGPGYRLVAVQVLYDGADYGEGVFVVLGEVVGDTRVAGVDLGPAEIFRGYFFAGCSLY
jgi:hypothetical protein